MPATMTEKTMSKRLAILAALDTDGNVYFSLTHANTDSSIVKLFFVHFCALLDNQNPSWRDDSVLLLDNAKYHTSAETLQVFK